MCECWEDLEKSELLDKKLQQMGLKAECHSSSAGPAGELDKMSPAATACGPVKILRRPSADPANSKHEDDAGTKLNVNSQPFVPRSQAPAIQLEDSTRTQFKPKLMILKREKTGIGAKSGADGSSLRQAAQTRTFEEREAQYLKARERIMGSATCSPSEPAAQVKHSSPASLTTPPNRPAGQPEVPLLRQPQGPAADGDRGFVRTKR